MRVNMTAVRAARGASNHFAGINNMITEKDMQSDDVMIKRAIVRIVALIVIGGVLVFFG